ncbi:unnamed protein product [Symbiodinium natans]|uniref:Gamma-glutamylcyclotransferase AIG2-like domain-containing protein n=1 Tax=Symbiodinium natans TaxID=878477 RepID=A0A812QKV8_9DINO|nr:unnamed protein product [Symbiodinium natans]
MANPVETMDFVFGYGSIIDCTSRTSSMGSGACRAALRCQVLPSFNFQRAWNFRAPSGFTALGLQQAESGEAIDGICFAVGNDMASFDLRERGYTRWEIPLKNLSVIDCPRNCACDCSSASLGCMHYSMRSLQAAVRGQDVVKAEALGQGRDVKVWVYVPNHPAGPAAAFPLIQSYIDVVIGGCLQWGETELAKAFCASTRGWSKYYLNDVPLSRRPWVNRCQAWREVDQVLESMAEVTLFSERRHDCEFAANFSEELCKSDRRPQHRFMELCERWGHRCEYVKTSAEITRCPVVSDWSDAIISDATRCPLLLGEGFRCNITIAGAAAEVAEICFKYDSDELFLIPMVDELYLCLEDVGEHIPVRNGMVIQALGVGSGPTLKFEVASRVIKLQQSDKHGSSILGSFTEDVGVGPGKVDMSGLQRCSVPGVPASLGRHLFVLRWKDSEAQWQLCLEKLSKTWLRLEADFPYLLPKDSGPLAFCLGPEGKVKFKVAPPAQDTTSAIAEPYEEKVTLQALQDHFSKDVVYNNLLRLLSNPGAGSALGLVLDEAATKFGLIGSKDKGCYRDVVRKCVGGRALVKNYDMLTQFFNAFSHRGDDVESNGVWTQTMIDQLSTSLPTVGATDLQMLSGQEKGPHRAFVFSENGSVIGIGVLLGHNGLVEQSSQNACTMHVAAAATAQALRRLGGHGAVMLRSENGTLHCWDVRRGSLPGEMFAHL